CQQESHWPLTF
nr:immunoglobulin light chain junction region [Macaca mulatta]